MYELHYNNSNKLTEAKFKKWSKQAFKKELKKLSRIFYDFDKI